MNLMIFQRDENKSDLTSLFSIRSKLNSIIKIMKIQPLRLFYFCLIPKSIRRKILIKSDSEIQKQMSKASRDFIELYLKNGLTKFDLKPKQKINNDKIIWQYWGQGITNELLPEIVKISFKSIDIYQKGYQIIRLDDNNINEYLDLPEFVWEKRKNKKFKFAFFSDLLRLALLDVYGGIWMDATILLTDSIPENIESLDFFLFQRDKNATDKIFFENYNKLYFGWHMQHYVNILNSFIVSKKKGLIVHVWLDLLLNFWKTQKTISHYFFAQIMFDALINHEKFRNFNCPVSDDTLVHIMQARFDDKFDPAEFERIKQKTVIHKLKYVEKCRANSYYDHIKKIYL